MNYREATINDIRQIQIVRHSVKENVLSNPALVTDQHCADYLTTRGKGWVCEVGEEIVGFAIVDLQDHNVWALFIHPAFQGQGIGRYLHLLMLNWYFTKTIETLWLSTEVNTRAEQFYRLQGWKYTGKYGTCESRFEFTYLDWIQKQPKAME